MVESRPKKIILLSDGTGNSSISRDKSNVWRISKALDLQADKTGFHEQVVFYDNGVGTSGFKPLTVLGGAFGWGLSRNVRRLYSQLCRHYRPGDKVYIFGFSRGAFTARVLAHFIGICGILDTKKKIPAWPHRMDSTETSKLLSLETEKGFNRAVSKAYKSYRKTYWQQNTHFIPMVFSAVGRWIREIILRSDVLAASKFKKIFGRVIVAPQNPIEFIGVWDTVDAVGLPIDELASALDKYIYPYQFKDQKLGDYVGRAAHALAIDDERHTFHPLLWDQSTEKDQNRIEQVWFSGMHSNVGGGYPEDDLALIPLKWMMDCVGTDRLGDNGLKFSDKHVQDIVKQAQYTGKMYNSRSGLGVFYRYRPRNLYRLCHDGTKKTGVDAGNIVLHHSVLRRIRNMNAGYAPAVIPKDFRICDRNGLIVSPNSDDPLYESTMAAVQRGDLLSRSEDIIAWGRLAYFCMLVIALLILAFPLFFPGIPGWKIDYSNFTTFNRFNGFIELVARGISYLDTVLPVFWVNSWQQHVPQLSVLVGLFGLFFWWGKRLKLKIQRLAETGWSKFKEAEITAPRRSWWTQLSNYLRINKKVRIATDFFAQKLVPLAFFGGLILAMATLLIRTEILPMVAEVDPCNPDPDARVSTATYRQLAVNDIQLIDISVDTPCTATGIDLQEGRRYKVSILETDDWEDRSFPILRANFPASNAGLDKPWDSLKLPFAVALPLKRHLTLPWFALTARIGLEADETFVVNKSEFTFKAQSSGPLYFYVNDAINSFKFEGLGSDWDTFYKHNIGTAKITIMQVE